MGDLSSQSLDIPLRQQAIRDKCFHPTGTFVEFKKEEIEQSIPDRFEEQVRRYPERLAVKTRKEELTYDELNIAANRVAHTMLDQGVAGNERVAFLLEQAPRHRQIRLGRGAVRGTQADHGRGEPRAAGNPNFLAV